jgi:hypothetical protein
MNPPIIYRGVYIDKYIDFVMNPLDEAYRPPQKRYDKPNVNTMNVEIS